MSKPIELLSKLSQTHGASGFEDAVRAVVSREFTKWADAVEVTPLGSVIGIKRGALSNGGRKRAGSAPPRLLIEAHMDEIGLLVTEIKDGFIRFDEVGSFDPRVLPSQSVIVHGRQALPGIIGTRPPHVLSAEERTKTVPLHDLYVDVGLPAARISELVSIGDPITMDAPVTALENGMYAGKAFDDRSSLAVLLELLRQLHGVNHAWDVYAVANVNEEDSVHYVGALTSTLRVQPQLAICLDVTHASQHGLSDGDMPQLGQGPCIARGANVHPVVHTLLQQAAARAGIPYQVTVYGGNTGTNAWMMQVAGEGVPTGLVEIPLRYMHTPVEMLALDDVTNAVTLLNALVTNLGEPEAEMLQGEHFVRTGAAPAAAPSAPRPRRDKRAPSPRVKSKSKAALQKAKKKPARRTKRASTRAHAAERAHAGKRAHAAKRARTATRRQQKRGKR